MRIPVYPAPPTPYYAHGIRYLYPWVPFSTTIVGEKETFLKKEGNEKKLTYELRDRESGNSLPSGLDNKW